MHAFSVLVSQLFNGRFQDVAATESIEALRTRLSVFMHFFIQTVHFKQLRFFTDIHGVLCVMCLRYCLVRPFVT